MIIFECKKCGLLAFSAVNKERECDECGGELIFYINQNLNQSFKSKDNLKQKKRR